MTRARYPSLIQINTRVWQTGPAAQQVSRGNAGWRNEFQETLPHLREKDIAGWGFAIQNYTVRRSIASAYRNVERLHGTVERSFKDADEKQDASVADRQGLGIGEEHPGDAK